MNDPDTTNQSWPESLPGNAIVIDNESTGLDPLRNSLFQIAWKTAGRPTKEITFRPRPGTEVEAAALEINGMTWRGLDAIQVSYWEGIAAFFREIEVMGERRLIVAGLNPATVELGFLRQAWRDLGKPDRFFPFSHRSIDLHTLVVQYAVRKKLPVPAGGFQTNEISDLLGVEREPSPHRAIGGVEHELKIFHALSRS